MVIRITATRHPENPQQIMRFEPGSLGPAINPQMSSRMMTYSSGLQPGEVSTSKTAARVPGMVNTWDITVRIEGRDTQEVETTDVVLVIDRSGSMADNSKMANAKSAARDFIDEMITSDPNLRIAIVSFASSYQGAQLVTTNHTFSRNTTTLKNAVNGLNALGGTHTQAGIIQGEALLDASLADNRYMVLLSDGQPTYSYEPDNWTNGRPSWGTAGGVSDSRQRTGVYDGNFSTSDIVGTGNALTQSYTTGSGNNERRRHIHNGWAAIKAGEDARADFDGLFTIAVQAGNDGTDTLEDIASPGMAYSTDNPGDLQDIYDTIATQISTQYAIRNAVITDEMGDGFSLISGSITKSEGTTSVAPANASNNETITWTIDPYVQQLVPGSTDVRYAEMTYRIEINDDILDIPGAMTDDGKLFESNKFTQLAYKKSNDQNDTKNITSPKVDPVLLKIKKILLDDKGDILNDNNLLFNVQISKGIPDSFNHTQGLVANAGYVWLTSLRYEGTYNVLETSISGTGITDLSQYDISYKINGADATSFLVDHISGKPRGDVVIDVTNKLIPQTVDVIIEKEITGNFGDLTRAFAFTVIVDGDTLNPRNFNLSNGGSITLEDIPKNAVLTLTEISTGYEVTVKVGGNAVTANPNGSYTITLLGEPITIEVTNHKDVVIDTGISIDSLPYVLILAIATIGLGVGFVRKRSIRKED